MLRAQLQSKAMKISLTLFLHTLPLRSSICCQSTHSGPLYKHGINIVGAYFIITCKVNLNMLGTSFILSEEFQTEITEKKKSPY